jgi:putative two-component system response regulator
MQIVFRFRHADGSWRYLEAAAPNRLDTPSIQGLVVNSRDVTERKHLERLLARQNEDLKGLLASRTQELDEARFEILERLAVAAEYRDDVTGEHTRRVGRLAGRLALLLDYPRTQVSYIERAAPLHDVGKIGIPDSILLKPGRLTPGERTKMQEHALIGAHILAGSAVPYLQMAEEIAASHHERWDGKGYPQGLAGEDIPHTGRVVAVADVLDALTHDRPYKSAWSLAEAVEEIANQRGQQFDPAVVDALLALHSQHHAGAGTLSEFESGIQVAAGPWRVEDSAHSELEPIPAVDVTVQ